MPKNEGRTGGTGQGKPLLEWAAAFVGLVLTLALLGFIGWQALNAPETTPPAIVVTAERVLAVPGGFVVEITARNESPTTAAGVVVEGTLNAGGGEPIRSSVTLLYVPGHSERRGGLFFTEDPRAGRLELRALGYARP